MLKRIIISLAICTTMVVQANGAKQKLDLEIAKYSAIIATNMLSKDVSDAKALMLLKMSGALDHKNKTYLFTSAMVKRGMKPDPIASKVTPGRLFSVMQKRALTLMEEEYSKNHKVAPLVLTYLKVVERFQPRNGDVLRALTSLEKEDVTGDLEDLLAQKMDIEGLFTQTQEKVPKKDSLKQLEGVKLDVKLNFSEGEEELQKYFTMNDKLKLVEMPMPTGLNKKNRKQWKKNNQFRLYFPKSGGQLVTTFKFNGTFTVRFWGVFDRIDFLCCDEEVKLHRSKLEGVRWVELKRQDGKLIASVGKAALVPVKEVELPRRWRDRPTGMTIKCRGYDEEAWLKFIRLQGKIVSAK